MILVVSGDFDFFGNCDWYCKGLKTTKIRQATVYEYSRPRQCSILYAALGYTKVEIATHLTLLLEYYPITTIIAAGNCALLDPQQGSIGDIAIAINAFQHDLRFEPLGYPQGFYPRDNGISSCVSSEQKLIKEACLAANKLGYCYQMGNLASGDQFVASTNQASYLSSYLNALFVDSECGAIAEVAKNYNLPFIAIKGISNYGDDGAVVDYRMFEDEANLNALQVILTMLVN